ncbi:type I restriction enzyme EcoEI specificity protein [Gemmobacter aquaticus]|uniref:Type I restriction enzyme EcoEI specificity protein n=1 Tax=Gemmobacter aquaticus TaxID=490185 RepID=A0A918DEB8_9RHOB|nr:restriction endonuclease subunit S [Gemmobacter aquaticus]GGO34440.1 type I restriction enzyme EcoEI specificity protein [Gemmobacter aquaticus]
MRYFLPEELPSGWVKVCLNEVIDHHSGNSKLIKGKQLSFPAKGSYKGFSASGQDVWLESYEQEGPAIVISAVGARCGKCFMADGKWSAVANTHVLRFDPGLIEHRYLWYLVNDEEFWVRSGSGQPFVKTKASLERPVALPPLPEQKRIVAKVEELFSELDAGEENLIRARGLLGLYRQSLLKAAFQGDLTAAWREANKDKLEPPETLLARIRQERETRYAEALDAWQTALSEWRAGGEKGKKPGKPSRPAELVTSGSPNGHSPPGWVTVTVEGLLKEPPSNGRSVKDRKGGFKVLRLSAFKGNRLNLMEAKEGDWSAEDAEGWIVEEGDFFVIRGNGSKHLVGIGALAVGVREPVAYPDTMIRLAIDRDVALAEYFLLVWNSRILRDQIETAARTTAGIYKINQPHICGFAFPLPPLEEQNELVHILDAQLSAIDATEAEITTALAKIAALRQSILKEAFSGRLVPQDPKDEPAAALLARLKPNPAPARSRKPRT